MRGCGGGSHSLFENACYILVYQYVNIQASKLLSVRETKSNCLAIGKKLLRNLSVLYFIESKRRLLYEQRPSGSDKGILHSADNLDIAALKLRLDTLLSIHFVGII